MDADDTTERQARRLATLAALARPVQHEINNLLHVIYANLDMLKRSAAEGAPQRQLDRVEQATKRLESSARALLGLARRPVPDGASFTPAEALAALAPLLHLMLPAPGTLALSLPQGAGWSVAGDRAAFEETVLALAGAAAAMPRGTTLGLMLAQEGEAVELRVAWPEGASPPALPGGPPLRWPRG